MAFDELRVHGVSGTPPRDMLYTDPITDAPDNDYTKVYRTRDATHGFDSGTRVFHWGGLTAGNRFTALWIFLSPFALANMAGWLIRKRSSRATIAIRMAGVMLTAVFVAQLVDVVVIVETWAQARVSGNVERWLGFGAVVVSAVLVFLITGWISTQSHFDEIKPGRRIKTLLHPSPRYLQPLTQAGEGLGARRTRVDSDWSDPAAEADDGVWAADPRLWEPHSILHRLRRVNMTVSFTVVSFTAAAAYDLSSWLLLAVAAVGVVALMVVPWTTWRPHDSVLIRITGLSTPTALTGLGVVLTAILFADRPGADMWNGIEDVIFWSAVGMGIAAFVAVGNGKSIGALGLGLFLGASLGLASVTVARRALLEGPAAGVTDSSAWVAVWMLRLMLVLLATVAVLSLRRLDPEPAAFDGCSGLSKAEHRSRKLAWRSGIAVRRVSSRAGVLFTMAALTASVAAFLDLGLTLLRAEPGQRNVDAIVRPEWGSVVWWAITCLVAVVVAAYPLVRVAVEGRGWAAAGLVVALSVLALIPAVRSWVVDKLLQVEPWGISIDLLDVVDAALAIAVLVPAIYFFRSVTSGWGSGESRRKTGIIWDVVSFWPRFFHPLAPPAYGPNAVTQLRIETDEAAGIAEAAGARLTLSGHSQGSMIVTLALKQMAASEANRLERVLTYGSPLALIYGELFGEAGLTSIVGEKAGHGNLQWTNLWRKSDFLGGMPIGDGSIANHEADDIGHSAYECARQFRAIKSGNEIVDADPARPCGGC